MKILWFYFETLFLKKTRNWNLGFEKKKTHTTANPNCDM